MGRRFALSIVGGIVALIAFAVLLSFGLELAAFLSLITAVVLIRLAGAAQDARIAEWQAEDRELFDALKRGDDWRQRDGEE